MSIRQRNNVNVAGPEGAPVMLFAHGFGCDQSMWRFVAPEFERDHRVVTFDFIGHGNSNRAAYDSKRYSSLRGYAQDILDICAELDLRDVTLVGHSVSGVIGLLAAKQEPERFRKLVMIAPSPSYINDGDYRGGFTRADIEGLLDTLDGNYPAWASTMAPVIMANPDRPGLASELENSFCRTDPKVAREFARVTFLSDHRADLPSAPVPALVMQVTEDAIAPVSVGEYMVSKMPRSELALIATTGHCPHMSAPDLTIQAIRRYVTA